MIPKLTSQPFQGRFCGHYSDSWLIVASEKSRWVNLPSRRVGGNWCWTHMSWRATLHWGWTWPRTLPSCVPPMWTLGCSLAWLAQTGGRKKKWINHKRLLQGIYRKARWSLWGWRRWKKWDYLALTGRRCNRWFGVSLCFLVFRRHGEERSIGWWRDCEHRDGTKGITGADAFKCEPARSEIMVNIHLTRFTAQYWLNDPVTDAIIAFLSDPSSCLFQQSEPCFFLQCFNQEGWRKGIDVVFNCNASKCWMTATASVLRDKAMIKRNVWRL